MLFVKINNKGLIIIAALWIMAILMLLAIGLAHRISIELRLVKFNSNMLKARLACEAAAEFVCRVLGEDLNNFDSLNEVWATGIVYGREESIFKDYQLKEAAFSLINEAQYEGSQAQYNYGLSDEDSKLNINTATVAQLETFLLELDIPDAREIAHSILDWIDADDTTSFDGAEEDYYNSLATPYHCKNAPIAVIEELLLIKGMDEEKFEKIKPFVTVYTDGKININTVDEVVLRSLLISRGTLDTTARKLAKEIIDYRLGADGRIGTLDDGVFVRFQDIPLALSTPMSLGEFTKCLDIIRFKSSVFAANVLARTLDNNARKKVTFIFKKDRLNVNVPELIFWQEE